MTTTEQTLTPNLRTEPNAGHIADFADGMADLLSSSVNKFEDQDAFYDNTYTVWLSKAGRTNRSRAYYYTGKGAAIVRQAVDTQFGYEPRVHREPVGRAEDAEKLADDLEVWSESLFKAVALSTPVPAMKQFNFNLLLYGKAILEGPRFLAYHEQEEPEREPDQTDEEYEVRVASWRHDRDNWNPFTMKSPHPSTILCDPWARNPEEVVMRKTMYGYQLAALTEKKRRLGRKADLYIPKKRKERVKVEEYLSRYWHVLKVQGGQVFVAERNSYGFVYFQQAYSTFGWEQTDQEESDPKDLCGGILDNITDVLRAKDQSASAMHEQLMRKAYASRVTKIEGQNAQTAIQAAVRGEDITGVAPDDLKILAYPDVESALFAEHDRLESYAIDGTYTPALLGVHQPGVTTVGQQTILSRAASRKFLAIAQNDEASATVWEENVLRLMDAYGHDVSMRGTTIGRKNIAGVYAVSVTFDNADFLVQQQERSDAREDYKAGLISDETTRSRLGYENESREQNRKIKQLARSDPRVVRKLVDAAIEDMGVTEEDLAGEQAPPPGGPAALPSPVAPSQNGGGPVIYGPNGQPLKAIQGAGQVDEGAGLRQVNGAIQSPLLGG